MKTIKGGEEQRAPPPDSPAQNRLCLAAGASAWEPWVSAQAFTFAGSTGIKAKHISQRHTDALGQK